jgi:hypothetical protein
MNPSYKHLDAKLRIAELTIGQWVGIIVGALVGLVFGLYVSPFGPIPSLILAIYLGGLPAGAVFVASFSEFDLWVLMRSAWQWRRRDARYIAGPGAPTDGYHIVEPVSEQQASRMDDLDLAVLWGETDGR